MPQFNYKAKAGPKEIKTGTIQADNQAVVIKKLREEGLYPVSINEISSAPKKETHKKINSRDISAFTRQLSNLTRSGFPLATALSTLSSQAQNHNLKQLIENLHEKIQKGATFSDALSAYPESFSPFYLNMVKIGETSGKIDETLERLAEFKEREEDLLSQVKSALAYPTFLFVIGIVTIFILVTFFIPRLAAMFIDLGQKLPLPTLIVIQVSKFMQSFWWLLIIAVFFLIILAKSYLKIERNKLVLDGLLLRLPAVKSIAQKLETVRFSYALGILLKNGIPMLEALEVVTLSVDNRVFRKTVSSFLEKIKKGQSLSSCLQTSNIFPQALTDTVAVGEESGELTEMLLRITNTFETEVNRNVKTLVSFIEPMLILFIGGVVVIIVLSMFLPIFQISFAPR